jgi:SAM-dependent methyltransferase
LFERAVTGAADAYQRLVEPFRECPLQFDAQQSARVDKNYANPAIVEQRRRTLEALALLPNEAVLDVGCGPGYLTRDMAQLVGPNGQVHAIDISASMLEITCTRCVDLPWVQLHEADAQHIPLADASVDATVSVQVYLFAPDLNPVLAELYRVLRPGGRAVIVDTDWDSVVWHSSDAVRMQRLLGVWKRRYTDARVARQFPGALRRAGFAIELATAIPIVELSGNEGSYSAGTLKELPKFVSGKDGIGENDVQAWSKDQCDLSASGAYFFALNRFLFVARKPE